MMDNATADGFEMGQEAARTFPNDEAYERVKSDLDRHGELTLAHIGEVFGPDFWILIVTCLMDAQDAARAIQGAMNRLAAKEAK